MAKKFFYVCAGLFLLALSWHFGAKSAGAQAGTNVTGFTAITTPGSSNQRDLWVLTANGDLFVTSYGSGNCLPDVGPACFKGNIWGGATSARQESWGQVKARYRPSPTPSISTP